MGPTSPLLPWKDTTQTSKCLITMPIKPYPTRGLFEYAIKVFTSNGRPLCIQCLSLFSVHPSANAVSAVRCGYRPLEITGTSVRNAPGNLQHRYHHLTYVMGLYVHVLSPHLDSVCLRCRYTTFECHPMPKTQRKQHILKHYLANDLEPKKSEKETKTEKFAFKLLLQLGKDIGEIYSF